jgi:DNA-binding FadR family transcriptional regulator
MPGLKTSRVTEQAAAYLREEVRKGRWVGLMPGRRVLARELGVSHSTVQGALDLLEAEWGLLAEGVGKRWLINVTARHKAASLNIRILLYDRRELAQFESRTRCSSGSRNNRRRCSPCSAARPGCRSPGPRREKSRP